MDKQVIEQLSYIINLNLTATEKINQLTHVYKNQKGVDWFYIFIEIYPKLFGCHEIKQWFNNTVYKDFDDLSKIVIKKLLIM